MKTGQPQPLLQDGGKRMDGHGHPEPSFRGILAISVKRLDAAVRLDPLEAQFHGPAGLVEQANRECGQIEVVREENRR